MPANNVVISALFKEVSKGVYDATETDSRPRKVLRNGQILILRAGKIYTTTGVEVMN